LSKLVTDETELAVLHPLDWPLFWCRWYGCPTSSNLPIIITETMQAQVLF